MSTLAELRSQLIIELDVDPNQRIFSTDTLNTNINRALRRIEQDSNYSLPENSQVFTFTPASQETNLPANFMRIGVPQGVKQGESTPLMPIDYFELLGQTNLTDSSGSANWYYIRKDGNQWIIGLYPYGGGQAITVPYYAKLTEMSSDSDESPLDEDFDESIVQFAKYLTLRRKMGFEGNAQGAFDSYKLAYQAAVGNRKTYNEFDLKVGYQRRPTNWAYNPRGINTDWY